MMAAGKHIGDCSGCGSPGVPIVYGWSTLKRLCFICNSQRLRGVQKAKSSVRAAKEKKVRQIARKSHSRKPTDRQKTKWALDGEVNREIWRDRKHVCYECEKSLACVNPPKIYFSHVHSKGSRPDLRHEKANIVLHCPGCHRQWESAAGREKMPKTAQLFEKLSVEHQDNRFGR